jgi:hypothetical protein
MTSVLVSVTFSADVLVKTPELLDEQLSRGEYSPAGSVTALRTKSVVLNVHISPSL